MSEDDVYRADLKRLTSATEALTAELRLMREETIKNRLTLEHVQKESARHDRSIDDLYNKVNATALQQAGTKPAVEGNKAMIGLLSGFLGSVITYLFSK